MKSCVHNCAVFTDTEVNDINKQKFLAELGKLLTFMYEEDRQTALSMYAKMFDDTDDEQGLLHYLVSPTRQAVVIARAYNARARKLQVESRSRDSEDAEGGKLPEFVLAIEEQFRGYVPVRSVAQDAMENQFSLFENAPNPVQDGMDEVFPVYEGGELYPVEQNDEPDRDAADQQVLSFMEDFSFRPEGAEDEEYYEDYEEEYEDYEETVRVAKLPLLILFVVLAVPVTLV